MSRCSGATPRSRGCPRSLRRLATLHPTRPPANALHPSAGSPITIDTRPPAISAEPDSLASAFRDLHGQRLHGFALLVSLGDRPRAARAAAEALAAGAADAADLRHPERAAAWLRAHVLRSLRGVGQPARGEREALATLGQLGVGSAVLHGLAALDSDERAALVATAIEGFDAIDVETILGTSPSRARRAVADGLAGYVSEVGHGLAVGIGEPGPVGQRVREAASRAIGPSGTERQ